mmetsp:Transcript_11491/g.15007  ORF Transcript_11491/g.15007 Transcript_11491/m.15007 type:complete len:159 (+) Transcript_11491:379-855(+)
MSLKSYFHSQSAAQLFILYVHITSRQIIAHESMQNLFLVKHAETLLEGMVRLYYSRIFFLIILVISYTTISRMFNSKLSGSKILVPQNKLTSNFFQWFSNLFSQKWVDDHFSFYSVGRVQCIQFYCSCPFVLAILSKFLSHFQPFGLGEHPSHYESSR